MKSILNDVNRLEKASELLVRLTKSANLLNEQLAGCGFPAAVFPVLVEFNISLKTANAFIEKYGNDK